jgi:hypothetical protein
MLLWAFSSYNGSKLLESYKPPAARIRDNINMNRSINLNIWMCRGIYKSMFINIKLDIDTYNRQRHGHEYEHGHMPMYMVMDMDHWRTSEEITISLNYV